MEIKNEEVFGKHAEDSTQVKNNVLKNENTGYEIYYPNHSAEKPASHLDSDNADGSRQNVHPDYIDMDNDQNSSLHFCDGKVAMDTTNSEELRNPCTDDANSINSEDSVALNNNHGYEVYYPPEH